MKAPFIHCLKGFPRSVLLLLLTIWVFSPYGTHPDFDQKLIHESVIIQAPVEQVYVYLGNSDNARHWSTFVDHITPLNPETHSDGTVGAQRRCFKQADEAGIVWDEEILVNEPNRRRQLSVYHLNGFSLQADDLRTEQVFTALDDQRCEVALTLFYAPGTSNWLSEFKMIYAAYTVAPIFRKNLHQIKQLNESRSA